MRKRSTGGLDGKRERGQEAERGREGEGSLDGKREGGSGERWVAYQTPAAEFVLG